MASGGCVTPWPTPERCSRYFSEYEEYRRKTLGEEATRPHRITYRKLARHRNSEMVRLGTYSLRRSLAVAQLRFSSAATSRPLVRLRWQS